MKQYLLDTHILLWYLCGSASLPDEAKEIINNGDNVIYYSSMSLLEIEIKHQKNVNAMPVGARQIRDACIDMEFECLPLLDKHIFQLSKIDKKVNTPKHQDPFDLVLLAQAKSSSLNLLTNNHCFNCYDEKCILIA